MQSSISISFLQGQFESFWGLLKLKIFNPIFYQSLELDPGYVEKETFTVEQRSTGNSSPRDNFRTLGFTVGYNRSDATYGWNGYMNGLTVFYLNPIEKYQQEEHSYPLVPGTDRYNYSTQPNNKIKLIDDRYSLFLLRSSVFYNLYSITQQANILRQIYSV